jgi:F420H(2)-dependent quinone reductase
MSRVANRAMAMGNKVAAWLYRQSEGRLGGSARGVPVLLLTVEGRNSGVARSVPVAGSAGGAKEDPQWIRNLAAARKAHIQIRDHEYDVDARIAGGDERDELWKSVVVARAPSFARYEEKPGRLIPIAVLTPRSG